MLIYFPYMHAELVPFPLVDNALFLDPGVEPKPISQHYYRPQHLPVSSSQGAAMLNDFLAFGAQFKSSSEMAFWGAQSPEEYFNESTLTIKNELTARLHGESLTPEEVDNKPNAHFILMLAWSLEKNVLASRVLEHALHVCWDDMEEGLGVGSEDERLISLGRTVSDTMAPQGSTALPWQRILESLPPFLPDGAVLLVGAHEPWVAVWEEIGITFVENKENPELPAGSRVAQDHAWRFSGRSRCPKSMPWADIILSVAILPQD